MMAGLIEAVQKRQGKDKGSIGEELDPVMAWLSLDWGESERAIAAEIEKLLTPTNISRMLNRTPLAFERMRKEIRRYTDPSKETEMWKEVWRHALDPNFKKAETTLGVLLRSQKRGEAVGSPDMKDLEAALPRLSKSQYATLQQIFFSQDRSSLFSTMFCGLNRL